LGLFFALDGNTYSSFGIADYIRDHLFPSLADFLKSTPLAEWKSGRLIELFEEKEEIATRMLIHTICTMSFLAFLPLLKGRRASVAPA
jgi:hypothetical protein